MELELPNTLLKGVIYDVDGQPTPAILDVHSADLSGAPQTPISLPVKDDGEFELQGLTPGRFELQARKRDEAENLIRTQEVIVDIAEGQSQKVELQFEDNQALSGQVVSPSGDAVPGAFVFAYSELASGTADLINEETYTDVNGVFEFSVRDTARAVQLSVYPPGFSAMQQRVLLPTDRAIMVPVESAGGTLVLEWDQTDEAIEDVNLSSFLFGETVLVRDSLVGVGMVLNKWSLMNRAPMERGRLVMPMMEPGHYTACFGDQAEFSAKRGDFSPYGLGELCTSGFLGAGQELMLTIPTD